MAELRISRFEGIPGRNALYVGHLKKRQEMKAQDSRSRKDGKGISSHQKAPTAVTEGFDGSFDVSIYLGHNVVETTVVCSM